MKIKYTKKTFYLSENQFEINQFVGNLTPSVFNTWFSFSSDQHTYETSSS